MFLFLFFCLSLNSNVVVIFKNEIYDNDFLTCVEIILCSTIQSEIVKFHICLKRIYIVQLFCFVFSLSLPSIHIYMTKFVYYIFHIIMIFFIYEILIRKGESYPYDCKFVISLYNSINICFTDFEVILLDNVSFNCQIFWCIKPSTNI